MHLVNSLLSLLHCLIFFSESTLSGASFLQAYTNELELEVAHLMEENARLKKQQEQVSFILTSTTQIVIVPIISLRFIYYS